MLQSTLVRCISAILRHSRVKMENIEDIRIEPCTKSRYVQPFRVLYKQNRKEKLWDCVRMHDSLAILIYNKTRNAFVIVKQFRPAVYMSKNRPMWENSEIFQNGLSHKPSYAESEAPSPKKQRTDLSDQAAVSDTAAPQTWGPGKEGCTYELCAGIVDKDLSLEHIAKEEVLEETGYDVPIEALERVNSYRSSIGTGGTRQQLFYCEVTDDMLVSGGGGNTQEGESIEVVYISVEDSTQIVFDESISKSTGLCFGFLWFDKYKKPQLN